MVEDDNVAIGLHAHDLEAMEIAEALAAVEAAKAAEAADRAAERAALEKAAAVAKAAEDAERAAERAALEKAAEVAEAAEAAERAAERAALEKAAAVAEAAEAAELAEGAFIVLPQAETTPALVAEYPTATATAPDVSIAHNRAGHQMRLSPLTGIFYCGRYIGAALPHSDGHCGPNNGPQCQDCQMSVYPMPSPHCQCCFQTMEVCHCTRCVISLLVLSW